MTMAAVTMTQVSGMRRGKCIIGKTDGVGITMPSPIRASNWIINTLHAKRMSRNKVFSIEGVGKFSMDGSCKWINTRKTAGVIMHEKPPVSCGTTGFIAVLKLER